MKKWSYTGDVNPENGGTWFYNKDLKARENFVSFVFVHDVNGDNIFLIEDGTVWVPHDDADKLNERLQGFDYCLNDDGVLVDMANGAPVLEAPDPMAHNLLLAEACMAYSGGETQRRVVVQIGPDPHGQVGVDEEIHGHKITHRVRANTKLINFIKREFL